jgi:hypothetical protein
MENRQLFKKLNTSQMWWQMPTIAAARKVEGGGQPRQSQWDPISKTKGLEGVAQVVEHLVQGPGFNSQHCLKKKKIKTQSYYKTYTQENWKHMFTQKCVHMG